MKINEQPAKINNHKAKRAKSKSTKPNNKKSQILTIFYVLVTTATTILHIFLAYKFQAKQNFIDASTTSMMFRNTRTTMYINRTENSKPISQIVGPIDKENEDAGWMCVLYKAGGRVLPPIKFKFEIWRFFTSIFLHINRNHLLSNLFLLYFLLKMSLKTYTAMSVIKSFFLTGVFGTLISCLYNPNELTVGLSPAVFGILGLGFWSLVKDFFDLKRTVATKVESLPAWKTLGFPLKIKILRSIYRSWFIQLIISSIILLLGVWNPYSTVDVTGHLAGLFLGFFYGFIEVNCLKYKKLRILEWLFNISIVVFSSILIWGFDTSNQNEEHLAAAFNMGCN